MPQLKVPTALSKLGCVVFIKRRGRRRVGPTLPPHALCNVQQYDKQPMAETMADTAPASAQRHSNSVLGPLRFSPPMCIGGSGRKRMPLWTAWRAEACSSRLGLGFGLGVGVGVGLGPGGRMRAARGLRCRAAEPPRSHLVRVRLRVSVRVRVGVRIRVRVRARRVRTAHAAARGHDLVRVRVRVRLRLGLRLGVGRGLRLGAG